MHRLDLRHRVRVRCIDHVKQHIGIRRFFQGGAERLDKVGRQVAHETDRVGQRIADPVRGFRGTHGWVQRGEQCVLHKHPGVREPVEQRGLACVGVADDGHRRNSVTLTVGSLGFASGLHGFDFAAQLSHPVANATTVELDLRFTGATRTDTGTASDLATSLTRHRLTPTAKTRQEVFELCELNLGFTFAGFSVLSEDIQDQRGPVNDFDLDDVFETTTLGWCKLTVDNHGVRANLVHDVTQLGCLTRTEVRSWVRFHAALDHAIQHFRARGFGERGKLTQRVLGLLGSTVRP